MDPDTSNINPLEKTLAIIKPDAVHLSEEIEDIIVKSGFTVLESQTLQLSPAQCSEFYAAHGGKTFFPSLTAFLSSGPIVALILACKDAVVQWKSLLGPVNSITARATHPESLRAKYGTCDIKNALHGSESVPAAKREIKFMFPDVVTEPLPKREETDYLDQHVNPTLVQALTELCIHRPRNPCMWLGHWLMKSCSNKTEVNVEEEEDKKKEENKE